MNPVALVVGFLLFGLFAVKILESARTARRAARLSSLPWDTLVRELLPVRTKEIAVLARNHLQPSVELHPSDPKELWDSLGGADGIAQMGDNVETLVALASYAERWDPDNSRIVAAKIRRDGLLLRRAINGVGMGTIKGELPAQVSLYFHEAASSYYLMTKRLLVLYRASHEGLAPVLEGIFYEFD